MNKYFIVAFTFISAIHSMEQPRDFIQKELQKNSFTDLIVLDYDGNADNAFYMAKTAKMVHSDITGKDSLEIAELQKKYAHVDNLKFTTPQAHMYDAVTIYNCNILTKKNLMHWLSIDVKEYLKLQGEVHAHICMQTHFPSIYEAAFLALYPQIYKSSALEIQESVKKKYLPDSIVSTLKSKCLTDESIKDIIWTSGYEVLFSEEVMHEDTISQSETKEIFFAFIKDFKLLQETKKALWKQYISFILDRCKKDEHDDIVFPVKATKFILRNEGNIRNDP